MTYCILDVEVTIRGPDNSPSAHWPNNKLVLCGTWMPEIEPAAVIEREAATSGFVIEASLLVGHNIGFDLHWLMREHSGWQAYLGQNMRVWDTQKAEFILSNQTMLQPSLDECAAKRGGTLKDTFITDLWAAGVDTADILRLHPGKLEEYLAADLRNTDIVYLSQYAEAKERGLLPLIESQMECHLATIDMTWNGLAIDQSELERLCTAWRARIADVEAYLSGCMGAIGWPDFNPNSPAQLAVLLFGGQRPEQYLEEVGVYKTGPRKGQPKFRTAERLVDVVGLTSDKPEKRTPGGMASTDESVLSQYQDIPIIGAILQLREINKQLTTYGEGIQKRLSPDGLVHHKLNGCIAKTGRLTSSEPNLQNVTNGPIKAIFISRWGDLGAVLDADYAQLEMVGLAVCSQDEQMLHDIRSGQDLHIALYTDMYGRPPTKDERKAFKPLSFGLVYGAGAATLAENAGVSLETAKRFIEVFYTRYPGVKAWHDSMYALVQQLGQHKGLRDSDGTPVREAVWISLTGRGYHFREYDAPDWMKEQKRNRHLKSFSPTEVKNYPVQGLATGDIVPMAVGKLYRALYAHPTLWEHAKLVNTVHDSIMIDCRKNVVQEVAQLTRDVLRSSPAVFAETFGKPFPLPLEVGISFGPTWLHQEEVPFNSTKESTYA